ncbi:MAG: phosphomannomutase/phosphoglucomutase [Spirochaetia bacterium]|nr:phosphomannomutase/phosphoglucomutase [Spirochaetia bacterium]
MSVFKENDIRGLFPKEWDKELAFLIGNYLPEIFQIDKIVIGRDGRESSIEILEYLNLGLATAGVDVTEIGIVDTPAVYFAIENYNFDLGIMITASHNPAGYNGLKITGNTSNPIDIISGIEALEKLVILNKNNLKITVSKDNIKFLDIKSEYVKYLGTFHVKGQKLKAVFDCSNGSGGKFIDSILSNFSGEIIVINSEIDGNFPNHGPNPVLKENLKQIQEVITENKADIGFVFDGDADRVVMIDGSGEIISPDLITAILGLYYFKYQPQSFEGNNTVLVDIRSSNSIREYLTGLGAEVELCPAGHGKIKKIMRDKKALFAGELSGHYYFMESFYSDSAWLSIFRVLSVLSEETKTLLELKNEILQYHFSGEISFQIEDKEGAINRLLNQFNDALINNLDGYRFDYSDWWFIIRKSGTEPLIRLVVEAKSEEILNQRIHQLTEIITKDII